VSVSIVPLMFMAFACVALVVLTVVTVAEELRHRRHEREVNIEALVTAFRIHEVAASAREAMSDELARLSEGGE
jgi:hypothetical protein